MREVTKEKPLLMIPGPVESHPDILAAMSQRTLAHSEQQFVDTYQSALLNMRQVFDVPSDYSPLVVAGGGTLAMEIAMINLVDKSKDQTALICNTGYFGDRFIRLAESLNLDYTTLSAEAGKQIPTDQLSGALHDVDFAFIQHVDTSTGVVNNIKTFAKLCQEENVISIVDGVCALGGEELHQGDWGIDIYLTGAQKALAVPPGLAILMYSPRARQISEARTAKIPSFYSDLDNWWPIMDSYLEGEVNYFSTPATNLVAALESSTNRLLEEGMNSVYKRHQQLADLFRNSLSEMGFDFITHENCQAVTMSTPRYLDAMDGLQFRKSMLDNGVLVGRGIQKGIGSQYFRVGHMGFITEEEIEFTVDAISKSI